MYWGERLGLRGRIKMSSGEVRSREKGVLGMGEMEGGEMDKRYIGVG